MGEKMLRKEDFLKSIISETNRSNLSLSESFSLTRLVLTDFQGDWGGIISCKSKDYDFKGNLIRDQLKLKTENFDYKGKVFLGPARN